MKIKIFYLVEERTWLRLPNSVEIGDIDELIVKAKPGVGIQVFTLAQDVSQVTKTTISNENQSEKLQFNCFTQSQKRN